MIKLRAHHLLCVFGWRGHGYDRAFTENFDRLVKGLDRDSRITLVEGADDICARCPRLDEDNCRAAEYGSGETAGAIDKRVADALGLSVGDTLTFGAVAGLVRASVTPENLSDLCAGCGWLPHGWCSAGLNPEQFGKL